MITVGLGYESIVSLIERTGMCKYVSVYLFAKKSDAENTKAKEKSHLD